MKALRCFYQFSLESKAEFWSKLWDFCQVIAPQKGDCWVENWTNIEKTRFFPEATLNFAENLLRSRAETVAIEFYGEDKLRQTLTHHDLYQQVAKLADTLKQWGIEAGDRVAGYLPNLPETVIAMLATASIGAVWSCCSPDFGITGVVDRFGQIAPKVLFLADGYYYHGKKFNSVDKFSGILAGIPSIEKVVIISSVGIELAASTQKTFIWTDLMAQSTAEEIDFVHLEFNHPLYILFSSGTTGIPKCIVHRAGGGTAAAFKRTPASLRFKTWRPLILLYYLWLDDVELVSLRASKWRHAYLI